MQTPQFLMGSGDEQKRFDERARVDLQRKIIERSLRDTVSFDVAELLLCFDEGMPS